MISKGLLLVRPVGNLIQKRGMASIKNWKRPSMDEMLGPKEKWEVVHARRHKEGNMYLAFGLTFILSTISYMISIEFIDPKPNPLNWEGVKK